MSPNSPVFHTEESVSLPYNSKPTKTPSPFIKMTMLACRASKFYSFISPLPRQNKTSLFKKVLVWGGRCELVGSLSRINLNNCLQSIIWDSKYTREKLRSNCNCSLNQFKTFVFMWQNFFIFFAEWLCKNILETKSCQWKREGDGEGEEEREIELERERVFVCVCVCVCMWD